MSGAEERPNRLYKYEAFSAQALENLKNHALFFASPSGFNDPYDCAVFPSVREPTDAEVEFIRSHYLAKLDLPETVRRAFQRTDASGLRVMLLARGQDVLDQAVREFLTERGVSCFSERNDSLLMWAHYGGRFKGFCLEFSADCLPFSKARRVIYADAMPEINIVPLLCGPTEDDSVLNLYGTKALDWAYEKEWRCFHDKAGTLYTYPPEALTGIYIGPDAAFASLEIVALIVANQNPDVQIWKGSRSKAEFSVVFEPVDYTPHLEAKRRGLIGDT